VCVCVHVFACVCIMSFVSAPPNQCVCAHDIYMCVYVCVCVCSLKYHQRYITQEGVGSVTFADFDGDGAMDFLFPVCVPAGSCSQKNEIHILYNKVEGGISVYLLLLLLLLICMYMCV